ncbi:glycosyltransferase family A protein [Cohnella cholangitidis]|uniref:Glycosyltransferase family 2 protein n=1 Tax=Cohnella cholangitidis TaxID=2598458 RepID=A0A7G5BV03_9BACL|nr:glycosyltransferase family A protein [Cohnella cholangitidis]QMV40787.1 glycosyltransferase family 2 protein [Cohnella cholangitidis]
MMPNKCIQMEIQFNGRSEKVKRSEKNQLWQVGLTKEWIEYRLRIFMKYTLQSLKKQTNQNFTALIKYASASEGLILKSLAKYEPLPDNIRFIPRNRKIRNQKKFSAGCEDLYLVRLDCDDTYHKTFIQQLHDFDPKPDTIAIVNQAGYIYDSTNHRMASVTMPSPNFYTWIYKTEDYFNGKRYIAQGGHKGVILSKHEILNPDQRNYMIVVHQQNTKNQKLLAQYDFETKRSKVNSILKNFI